MDPPEVYRVFRSTISSVVGSSNPERVPTALEDLAEGHNTVIDGVVISKLPGLGQQKPATQPDIDYQNAMMRLLSWGFSVSLLTLLRRAFVSGGQLGSSFNQQWGFSLFNAWVVDICVAVMVDYVGSSPYSLLLTSEGQLSSPVRPEEEMAKMDPFILPRLITPELEHQHQSNLLSTMSLPLLITSKRSVAVPRLLSQYQNSAGPQTCPLTT